MKSEPDVYSIDDLKKDKKTYWDGVRNYQARNFMRDEMKVGDEVLFYHSNATPPGVAGLAKVSKTAYPDFTAWDKKDKHYDPKSDPQDPRWYMVDIAYVKKFKNFVSLEDLKNNSKFEDMMVTKRGSRLSIQPVDKKHFDLLKKIGDK